MLRVAFSLALLALVGCETTPDGPVGLDDGAAALSCASASAAPTALTAASSASAAADAVIELPGVEDEAHVYAITLPEGVESYAVLRTSVMHNDAALFVSEADRIVHLEPDGIPSGRRHAVCEDTLVHDYRAHIHEPSDHVVTFAADGPRTFTLVAINAQIGHPPDGHEGDGGMAHHDEDGGHAHDHDGGHAHDHDGGHGHGG